jgi:hypothetical protein
VKIHNSLPHPKRARKEAQIPISKGSLSRPMKLYLNSHRRFRPPLNTLIRKVHLHSSHYEDARSMPEFGFKCHNQAFDNALCLRYGWPICHLPSHCTCSAPFSISHAFSCPKGTFLIIRHIKVRDLLDELLTEVCPCISTEPTLQPLSGESFTYRSTNTEDNARLDVCAKDCWDKNKTTVFFDVKVFNAYAPSKSSSSISSCLQKHKLDKRRIYKRKVIEVEGGTFSPFVMSTSGGMGPSALITIKRLANLISDKTSTPYSSVMSTIRCCLSFSLINSAIICIRGGRFLYQS